MTSPTPAGVVRPTAVHHVRLTVTDIERSKAFYRALFGAEPAIDMSDQAGDPAAREDPARLYAGCVFGIGDQLVGLRPVASAGDSFSSTRVGLDHISFAVGSVAELQAAVERLDTLGVTHGEPQDLGEMGMVILSLQDPDDINLELSASTG